MSYFPFITDITDKTFLIIGGGNVATDKIMRLKRFTDRIVVVAKETNIKDVWVIKKEYEKGDLDLGDYVVAATGFCDIDEKIAYDCRKAGKPVNVVDNITLCDFIFPAIIKKGKLTVSISTDGASPLYAGILRKEIEEMLPDDIETILDKMQKLREETSRIEDSAKKRAEIYKKALMEMLER